MFDFGVKPLKDRKHGAFDVLFGLEVGIGNSLRVRPDVFEEPGDSSQALVEVLSLFQRM